MKKLLAIALIVVMMLSFSVVAFAGPSESGGSSTDNTPAEVITVPTVQTPEAEIVADKDLTPEEEEQANEALEAAEEQGYVPVQAYVVEVSEDASEANPVEMTLPFTIAENQVLLVIDPDGNVIVFTPEELAARNNTIKVTGPCTIVIAEVK